MNAKIDPADADSECEEGCDSRDEEAGHKGGMRLRKQGSYRQIGDLPTWPRGRLESFWYSVARHARSRLGGDAQ